MGTTGTTAVTRSLESSSGHLYSTMATPANTRFMAIRSLYRNALFRLTLQGNFEIAGIFFRSTE